jgi:hypothetical protein
MNLGCIPWNDPREPGEGMLRARLEDEGFEVRAWRDPADRIYDEHHHDCDESLVVRDRSSSKVRAANFRSVPAIGCCCPPVSRIARARADGARY